MIAIIIDTLTQPRNPIGDEGIYEELDDIRMAMLPTQVQSPEPLLPVARPRLTQITHDLTQSTRGPTTSHSNSGAYTHAVDDTGGSHTGATAGDSGFGYVAFQRRLPSQPSATAESEQGNC